ncbi:glycosyltransferase [Adlercreutzia caecimuris]|uniref:Glycosyltransferase subfamily 4-like N-terminal domain-containing protein n=1 Tax=Adlercreutzia caecimuris B7 TaxID=1235794 RepID=R9L2Y8_9ACTN|nr:glycosyltransferase [Adlercreutzia caecimuris]EOS52878.1 hypothetical protein C811_00161 [Adlercreutzia caecimuris B7]
MNILQVSENYSAGGLEKFIDTISEALVACGHRSILAVGNLKVRGDGPKFQEKVADDFGFKANAAETLRQYVSDIDRLCALIEEFDIDAVLIHPYFSLFPAIAAARIMKVPVAYVAHGIGSCTFTTTETHNTLFRIAVDSDVDKVFVTQSVFKSFFLSETPVSLLRNPVAEGKTRSFGSALLQGRRWALCSRLDGDKLQAIEQIVSWLPLLGIEGLDVFGIGAHEESLRQFAEAHGVAERIAWHGFRESWLEEALELDAGVIGLGRVAIEALAANMPVILLGVNGGICGLVDDDLYDLSADNNFGMADIPTLNSAQTLAGQLDDYYADPSRYLFGDRTRELFSASRAVAQLEVFYENSVLTAQSRSDSGWGGFVNALRIAPEQETPYALSLAFVYLLKNEFSLSLPFPATRNSLFISKRWADSVNFARELEGQLSILIAQHDDLLQIMEHQASYVESCNEGIDARIRNLDIICYQQSKRIKALEETVAQYRTLLDGQSGQIERNKARIARVASLAKRNKKAVALLKGWWPYRFWMGIRARIKPSRH